MEDIKFNEWQKETEQNLINAFQSNADYFGKMVTVLDRYITADTKDLQTVRNLLKAESDKYHTSAQEFRQL